MGELVARVEVVMGSGELSQAIGKVDQALMDLPGDETLSTNRILAEINKRLGVIMSQVAELRERYEGVGGRGFECGTIVLSSADTPYQLPPMAIPRKATVTIKALDGNTGTIYVSRSAVGTSVAATRFELANGEDEDFAAENLSDIYVAASTANDGVSWLVDGGSNE